MNTLTAFGNWLKQRRRDLGLTQQELAARVGCSKVTIEKIEAGVRKPSDQIARLIAECFNVPPSERQAFVEYARTEKSPAYLAGLTADMEHAPWRALRAVSTNLPAPPTSFVGREELVGHALDLLRDSRTRLLTLVGPPGIGKTRLALQVAGSLVGDFEDGVYFIGLGPIRGPELVIPSVARTVGVRETGREQFADPLKRYLSDKRLLLVLDNFEQVIEAAPQLGEFLTSAPWVKMLVTSREALRIYGEHCLPVPPLSMVANPYSYLSVTERLMECEAVRLFVDRARAVNSDFTLTGENAAAVIEICLRLDRLPLAIELAAARVTLLSPQKMLSKLENMMELLVGGARDLPPRQQALRSAIEWSYDLLDEPDRALFRRLAVFVGGTTVDGTKSVASPKPVLGTGITHLCPPGTQNQKLQPSDQKRPLQDLGEDVEESLKSLTAKSLLRHEELHGESRFSMLETIREYAEDKAKRLGEYDALRWQHALYYLTFAERAKGELVGLQQAAWLVRLELEHDNLRATVDWLLTRGATEMALRLCDALWRFWQLHGHLSEGRRLLNDGLALPDANVSPQVRANALADAGNLAWSAGDFKSAGTLYEESLTISRRTGDKRGMARPLNNLAVLAYNQGDFEQSARLFSESLAIKRELRDEMGVASSLNGLGTVEYDRGNYAPARGLCEESLSIFRRLGNEEGMASALNNLGITNFALGHVEEAQKLYEEALTIRKELGDRQGMAGLISNLGEIDYYRCKYGASIRRYEESLALRREVGDEQGIANALRHLGFALQSQGTYRRAELLLKQAFELYQEMGDKPGISECLVGFATLATTLRQYMRAAALLGGAEALLSSTGYRLSTLERLGFERTIDALREAMGEEALGSARKAGGAMGLDEIVANALGGAASA